MSSKRSGLQRFREGDSPSRQAAALENDAAALDNDAAASENDAGGLAAAGRIAARQGDLDEARRLLRAAVKADPACTEAWLGLAWLAESQDERREYLERVLSLDLDHNQAQAEMARLKVSPRESAQAEKARLKVSPRESAQAEMARLKVSPRESAQAEGARMKGSPGESASADRDSTSTANSRRRWAPYLVWGMLALIISLLLVWLLVWGPVDSSLASLLSTPTPTPIPTPTLTPSEIAAQFESQLEAALHSGNWDRALELVAIMESVDPRGEAVDLWALTTRMQYGQALVETGHADRALAQFDEAVSMASDDPEALLWRETTEAYLAGEEALEEDQWDAAIASFTLAYERIPDYADVFTRLVDSFRGQGKAALEAEKWTLAIESLTQADKRLPNDPETVSLLAQAYRERGIAWQEKDKLKKARADLEAALDLRPNDAQARKHLNQVMYRLFPPKRIEIDISKQRLYAYKGDTMVYNWAVSTGLPGRDTAAGHYQVLSKIPMAYSYIWSLSMPYWLGIYYVGRVENGIHALPIRPDGTVMWGGLLGQRASYGCIILSNQAAKTLYNWAEIGTKVDIHY